jgi:hypothetical protein
MTRDYTYLPPPPKYMEARRWSISKRQDGKWSKWRSSGWVMIVATIIETVDDGEGSTMGLVRFLTSDGEAFDPSATTPNGPPRYHPSDDPSYFNDEDQYEEWNVRQWFPSGGENAVVWDSDE